MRTDDGRPSWLERAVDEVPFLEKELFLLRRIVAPGDVCIDVGAAGGAHLLVMARRVGHTGRVLGFEPRPGSHRVLRWLVERSGLGDRVQLLPVALDETTGRAPLRIPVVPTRAHFHGSAENRAGTAAFASLPHREISVPTERLDDVVAAEGLDRVDLLKCDVEGAERRVLAGAQKVLEHHRPVVLLEADDLHQRREDATAAELLELMCSYGYRVHRYRRGMLEAVDGVVDGEDDYVFVPRERTPRVPVREASAPPTCEATLERRDPV
jgi:FkbM family methyltransferase